MGHNLGPKGRSRIGTGYIMHLQELETSATHLVFQLQLSGSRLYLPVDWDHFNIF